MVWASLAIAKVIEIAHTTIINWIKQTGADLPDTYEPEELPQVGELDKLETQEKPALDLDSSRAFPSWLIYRKG